MCFSLGSSIFSFQMHFYTDIVIKHYNDEKYLFFIMSKNIFVNFLFIFYVFVYWLLISVLNDIQYSI